MNHWKKTVARSLGWIDHVRFGSDSSSDVATVMKNHNTLAGHADPFVAKLNDSDPTAEKHRTPSPVPPAANPAARMREVSRVADEVKHQHEQELVEAAIGSETNGGSSLLNTVLWFSLGFVSGVAALYHLKASKR